MSRMRRGSSIRASRGPKNNVWTVVQAEAQVQTNTTVEAVIVAPTDWSGVAGLGLERATLLRVRGWLSAAPAVEDVSTGGIFFVIYVVDEDAALVNPLDVSTYVNEDVLWTGGAQFAGQGALAIETRPSVEWEVDIKAMRKLTSGQEVRLAAQVITGLNVRWSGTLRGLVRKGGN